MGFFSKIMGGGREYPPLETSHPAAARLVEVKTSLEELASEIPDPLEAVPTEKAVYIFAGKPPKQFGMFWIQGSKLLNFKSLSKEKGLNSLDLQPIVEQLREAYRQNDGEERFSFNTAGRTILVNPSPNLGTRVEEIIQQAAS